MSLGNSAVLKSSTINEIMLIYVIKSTSTIVLRNWQSQSLVHKCSWFPFSYLSMKCCSFSFLIS